MWIKTLSGELLNTDFVAAFVYSPRREETVAVIGESPTTGDVIPIAKGNRIDHIGDAIARDTKLLEVI